MNVWRPPTPFGILFHVKINSKNTLLTILLICPVCILVGCWFFLTVNVPYWDDYAAFIKYFAEPWPDRWTHLFDLHNEHRIVTTRLIADSLAAFNGGVFNFRAMMAAGNLIQLAYAVGWLMVFKKSAFGVWAGLPTFWLLTSFLNYENSCWALTSVQNVIVIALAFAACQAFANRHRGARYTALAVFCAVGATYSSGGGMLIWPCLIAMEICVPLTRERRWEVGLRALWHNAVASWKRLSVLIIAAGLSIGFYFHGFTASGGGTAVGLTTRIVNGALFTVAFLGGIVPVYAAALLVGTILLPVLIYLIYRYPRIKTPSVFWFTMAEFGTMLTAAFFRSEDPHAAVSSRYCIVSCSVFAGVFFLFLEQSVIPKRLAQRGICLTTAGVILYTTAFLVLGAPLFAMRNELMRRNILTWPSSMEGLRSNALETDNEHLRRCVERGAYDPSVLLKPGETPPERPAPWLK